MNERPVVLDLSDLPTYGFSSRATTWWGTLAYCTLEGTGFALAIGIYLYLLVMNAGEWPMQAEPADLLPGTTITALMLLSLIPNQWVKRRAKQLDLKSVRLGLVAMSLVGLLVLGVRVYEFPALNIWWDTNAYGSVLWLILGLHTAHVATDVGDTLVVTALMFTRHGRAPRRFTDVEDNAFYWYFVVLSWLPLYGLIYWMPRA
jgi:heme/copper-type cytochrome/quinol oxidase subunit 3